MLHYNTMTGYNKARYNADGVELSASEGITVSDATVTKAGQKGYAEIIISVDSTAKQQNKSVTDEIHLDDWLRIRKEQPDPWSD